MPRSLISTTDMRPAEVAALVADAAAFRAARPRLVHGGVQDTTLRGRTIALIFEKPSTRTRISFEVAVAELGGHALSLASTDLQLGRGESVEDTGAVLGRYVHGIVMRTFEQDRLTALAEHARVPVINALTDEEHPCQALADLLTIHDAFGTFTGRTLTYVGDGNNVAHSLLVAAASVGLGIRVAHPEGFAPDPAMVAEAERRAAEHGSEVTIGTDAAAAAEGSDALYTDVWTSMGQEQEAAERRRVFASFVIDEHLLARAQPEAIVLHCLPAHRGEEISAAVLDGPRSRVFDQAENRLHAQKAVLAWLLGDGRPAGTDGAPGADPAVAGVDA
jgi:ornithine carbamoyltransferase